MTETTAVELGKILNVDAIFVFELTDLRIGQDPNRGRHISHVSIVGRLVNVEDGCVIWIENISTQQDNLITSLINLPVAILTMSPNEDRVEKKVNEIIRKDFLLEESKDVNIKEAEKMGAWVYAQYGVRADEDATTGNHVLSGDLVVTNSTVFGLNSTATAWGKAASGWAITNDNVSTTVALTDGVGTITGGADANAVYSDAFFTADTNIGAVQSSNNWLEGWAIKADGSDY